MCDGLFFQRQKQVQKTEKQNKRASKNVSIKSVVSEKEKVWPHDHINTKLKVSIKV